MAHTTSHRRGFTLVELLVVIGIISVLISILMPSLSKAREQANRIKCASNLRLIGLAYTLYANDNKNQFPRTLYDGSKALNPGPDCSNTGCNITDSFVDPANPTNTQPVGINNVPATLYLLARTEHLVQGIFICPSAATDPDANIGSGAYTQHSNFASLNDLSYSIANPYPESGVASSFKLNPTTNPEFALAADRNPGTASGQDVVNVKLASARNDIKKGNSLNHNREGQNVLYCDGHVEFAPDCFFGINDDNIYTRSNGKQPGTVQGDTGTDADNWWKSPQNAGDSVLLPAIQ